MERRTIRIEYWRMRASRSGKERRQSKIVIGDETAEQVSERLVHDMLCLQHEDGVGGVQHLLERV